LIIKQLHAKWLLFGLVLTLTLTKQPGYLFKGNRAASYINILKFWEILVI